MTIKIIGMFLLLYLCFYCNSRVVQFVFRFLQGGAAFFFLPPNTLKVKIIFLFILSLVKQGIEILDKNATFKYVNLSFN